MLAAVLASREYYAYAGGTPYDYLRQVTGSDRVSETAESIAIRTGDQSIILARPAAFEAGFGIAPPQGSNQRGLSGNKRSTERGSR